MKARMKVEKDMKKTPNYAIYSFSYTFVTHKENIISVKGIANGKNQQY